MIPMDEHRQWNLFESWIKNAVNDKSYFDHIAEILSDQYTFNLFADHVDEEIGKEKKEWNITLLYNPRLEESINTVQTRFQTLTDVKKHLWEWKIDRDTKEMNTILKTFDKLRPKEKPLTDPEGKKLSQPQIALICYYNGIGVTEDNAPGIAKKHGWESEKSGRKIWQLFLEYMIKGRRMGEPQEPTKIKSRNKIKLFESVLPFLNEDGTKRANEEIKLMKLNFTEYTE